VAWHQLSFSTLANICAIVQALGKQTAATAAGERRMVHSQAQIDDDDMNLL
jgi:hypothetical protein